MGYVCPKCGHLIPGNENSLLWHLKGIHDIVHGRILTENVTCERTFSGRTTDFFKHLKRHRNELELEPQFFRNNLVDAIDLLKMMNFMRKMKSGMTYIVRRLKIVHPCWCVVYLLQAVLFTPLLCMSWSKHPA